MEHHVYCTWHTAGAQQMGIKGFVPFFLEPPTLGHIQQTWTQKLPLNAVSRDGDFASQGACWVRPKAESLFVFRQVRDTQKVLFFKSRIRVEVEP